MLKKLPEGIYSDVGEGGKLLSGGERQMIAIARSIITNASILALDEATAALDNETAYLIEKTILISPFLLHIELLLFLQFLIRLFITSMLFSLEISKL